MHTQELRDEMNMKEDYLQNMLKIPELCQKLREKVEKLFYKKDGSVSQMGKGGFFCFYPLYHQLFDPIERVVEICDLFGIRDLERSKLTLNWWLPVLKNPNLLGDKSNFEGALGNVERAFGGVKNKIEAEILLLDSEEADRLNEAIHCFLEGCYYSTIAMSVSAIESRLFSLMTSANPKSKLKELTLGQLIREYLENKEKYGNVIPKKHEPLLEHCNIYRVFSVHPKKEEINKPIASSILNMTFLFLLDKKLAKKSKSSSKRK